MAPAWNAGHASTRKRSTMHVARFAAGMGELGELGGRAGDYDPHCGSDGRGEVCCKCGSGNDSQSYVCIEAIGCRLLASSLCPGGLTDTTTEPPLMTMTTNQSRMTTEGQQPMTTAGATLATTVVWHESSAQFIDMLAGPSFARSQERSSANSMLDMSSSRLDQFASWYMACHQRY